MPPKLRFFKTLTIQFEKSLYEDLERFKKRKRYDTINDAIRGLLSSSVNDKTVAENVEMRELLTAIRAGVTKETEENIVGRVNKILGE